MKTSFQNHLCHPWCLSRSREGVPEKPSNCPPPPSQVLGASPPPQAHGSSNPARLLGGSSKGGSPGYTPPEPTKWLEIPVDRCT